MIEKQRVALYIRVSTEEQVQGFSLEAQKSALYNYCKIRKLDIYKLYVDAGRSGKSISGRPSLTEMLEDARKGHFQQVICLRLNRLSRNLKDLLHITELFDQHGITLHSLTENLQTDSPMGKFALQMLGSIAEHERKQSAQNTSLGMQRRNRLGKWNSGNQVLGYRWVPHPVNRHLSYVEIIPDEAELVRTIFIWYSGGLGLKAIVNRLNKNGHQTKMGKLFQSISVRGILTNVNYIGKIAYTDRATQEHKKIVDGKHEPIVSKELWDKVQQQLALRSRLPSKHIDHTFLLTGLLKCPACGSSMIASHVSRKRKNKAPYVSYYYVCCRYNSGGYKACQPHHIRADQVEDWVRKHVQQFIANPAIAEQLVMKINDRRDKSLLPFRQQLKENETKTASLKKRNLRCYELFEDGHIDSKELKSKLQKLQSEMDALEQECEEIEQKITAESEQPIPLHHIRRVLADFKSVLQQAAPTQQKALFHSMLAKVTLPADRDISRMVIQGSSALLHLEIPVINKEGEQLNEVQAIQKGRYLCPGKYGRTGGKRLFH
ncbi:recombinase family protein [Paenibacillus sp. NPDC058177]|uniref:recombinase family protein n=1 Tax=Paenibacillus sp. NPDC058177 TaxID=3346369 RepID=UPI0036D9A004